MVAFARPSPVSPLVPPVGAVIAGACVAAVFALVPTAMLEDWVWRSGIPALIPAAAPPLATTARAVLALAGAAMAASVAWSALYLLVGPGGMLTPKTPANAVVVRRADAHPDAPPRPPMTAADLGTPLMEVTAATPPPVRDVPADLDQPLSAFDPTAIPDVPLARPAAVAPLARVALAPGERIDTYVLSPPPPSVPPAARREDAKPQVRPSIEALLARLESHAAQRLGGMTQATE